MVLNQNVPGIDKFQENLVFCSYFYSLQLLKKIWPKAMVGRDPKVSCSEPFPENLSFNDISSVKSMDTASLVKMPLLGSVLPF